MADRSDTEEFILLSLEEYEELVDTLKAGEVLFDEVSREKLNFRMQRLRLERKRVMRGKKS